MDHYGASLVYLPGFQSASRMAACTAATIIVIASTAPTQLFGFPKRSLLRSPSAVHDQWLAQRALDLAEPSEVPRHLASLSGNA